jgi:hypothetical protein
MAEARRAISGAQRFTVLDGDASRDGRERSDREAVIEALDDIASDTRTAWGYSSRIDQNTLTMVDQLAGIENRVVAFRFGLTFVGMCQILLLALILWRVW